MNIARPTRLQCSTTLVTVATLATTTVLLVAAYSLFGLKPLLSLHEQHLIKLRMSFTSSNGLSAASAAEDNNTPSITYRYKAYNAETAMSFYRSLSHPDKRDQDTGVSECLKKVADGDGSAKQKALAILMWVTSDRLDNPELRATASSWREFADHNGYTFDLVALPPNQPGHTHFLIRRWENAIVSTHWKTHHWVLGIDADSILRSKSMSLDPYLASPEDIHVHVRMNGEVTSAAVMLKTTPFSECFVQQWTAKKANITESCWFWDQGDMLQTMMDFAAPQLAPVCQAKRTRYSGEFTHCFYGCHKQLLTLHLHMPIKVWFPLSGFWHSQEGYPSNYNNWEYMYHHCWPRDIILHGWKRIGQEMWNASTGTAMCASLTSEKYLDLAKECCMWHYPGCQQGRINVCQQSVKCATSAGALPSCL